MNLKRFKTNPIAVNIINVSDIFVKLLEVTRKSLGMKDFEPKWDQYKYLICPCCGFSNRWSVTNNGNFCWNCATIIIPGKQGIPWRHRKRKW